MDDYGRGSSLRAELPRRCSLLLGMMCLLLSVYVPCHTTDSVRLYRMLTSNSQIRVVIAFTETVEGMAVGCAETHSDVSSFAVKDGGKE